MFTFVHELERAPPVAASTTARRPRQTSFRQIASRLADFGDTYAGIQVATVG